MALRMNILNKIINIFKLHGAETIDTPVFELKVKIILLIYFLIILVND